MDFYDLRPRGKRAAAILFASQYRSAVTPAQRGRGAATPPVSGAAPTKPSTPRHVAMSWARPLRQVFGVESECWARCGGQLQIIASIEEPELQPRLLGTGG